MFGRTIFNSNGGRGREFEIFRGRIGERDVI